MGSQGWGGIVTSAGGMVGGAGVDRIGGWVWTVGRAWTLASWHIGVSFYRDIYITATFLFQKTQENMLEDVV